MSIARASKVDASVPRQYEPVRECGLSKKFPNLVEFLSRQVWEDGVERECGTILLLWEDGVWKAWVNDKDGGRQAWLSGQTLEQLVTRVDKAVGTGEADWRAPREAGKGKRR